MSANIYKKEMRSARTQQNERERADVNRIVRRYMSDGQGGDPLTHVGRVPIYGDFSAVPDLATALQTVQRGMDMFYRLPAKTRERFRNSPKKLMEFVESAENIEEAAALGLLGKETVERLAEEKKKPKETASEPKKPSIDELLVQLADISAKINALATK